MKWSTQREKQTCSILQCREFVGCFLFYLADVRNLLKLYNSEERFIFCAIRWDYSVCIISRESPCKNIMCDKTRNKVPVTGALYSFFRNVDRECFFFSTRVWNKRLLNWIECKHFEKRSTALQLLGLVLKLHYPASWATVVMDSFLSVLSMVSLSSVPY